MCASAPSQMTHMLIYTHKKYKHTNTVLSLHLQASTQAHKLTHPYTRTRAWKRILIPRTYAYAFTPDIYIYISFSLSPPHIYAHLSHEHMHMLSQLVSPPTGSHAGANRHTGQASTEHRSQIHQYHWREANGYLVLLRLLYYLILLRISLNFYFYVISIYYLDNRNSVFPSSWYFFLILHFIYSMYSA